MDDQWRAYMAEVCARIEGLFPYPPPEYDLNFRYMFGGIGAYVRGRIFLIITDEGIAVKFAERTREMLHEQYPDVVQLSWTKLYLIMPPYVYDDEEAFSEWLRLSVDDVVHTPPKPRKPRARKHLP